MPIKYNGKELTNIEPLNIKGKVSFRLYDAEDDNSIIFDYIPIGETEFSYKDYQVVLLDNNYLNAENDVFQIFDKKEKIRLGWIFPFSNLVSNENDFSNNEYLNKYKYVAYQLLLLSTNKDLDTEQGFDEIRISNFYLDNPIVMVLSNNNIAKINNFSLHNYIPSLAKYGYYIQNEYSNRLNLDAKRDYCLNYRGKSKLNLTCAVRDIKSDRFFSELFSKHLKSLEHHLIRFHILYQVIEYTLSERFDVVFKSLISEYNASSIKKNDFIEGINQLGKERANIKKVVEQVQNKNCDSDIVNLERECKNLLHSHGKKIKNTTGDLIYDVRNLIVHNYRDIEDNEIESLEVVTHEMELLTINIIEEYSP